MEDFPHPLRLRVEPQGLTLGALVPGDCGQPGHSNPSLETPGRDRGRTKPSASGREGAGRRGCQFAQRGCLDGVFRVHRWGNDRFLVMVAGARKDPTEAVMAKFPTVDMVSRDRGSAYAAAADARGTLQVAGSYALSVITN